MDNRDRDDKVSDGNRPTEPGEGNRETSEGEGRDQDSSADFGQSNGRSDELNNGSSVGNIERSSPGRKQVDRSGRSERDH